MGTNEQTDTSAMGKPVNRILAMDQLRGFAIFSMILVNYLGHFDGVHWILKHHKTGWGFADVVAPLFIFVVGMGFRLSIQKRMERVGAKKAYLHAVQRYILLFVLGIFFYGFVARIDWWDALVKIGLSGLLALPFITKGRTVRIVAAFVYLGIFTGLYFGTPYGVTFMFRSMGGGPISPFSAVFGLLMGTIAYDLLASRDGKQIRNWSLGLAAVFFVLSVITWKLIPADYGPYLEKYGPYWAFSMRWTVPPAIFLHAGICFLIFYVFYLLCEVRKIQLPHLSILGENPLIIYLMQYSLMEMRGSYIPEDSILPLAILGYVIFYGFHYLAARSLHKQGIIIKL